MAKRSKIALRAKPAAPKAKAAARRRLAARKPPLRGTLKVDRPETSAPEKLSKGSDAGKALQSFAALLGSLPGWVIEAAAPALRKTERGIAQLDTADFVRAIMAALPGGTSSGKKSTKRVIAEEATVLAAAVALIALRRKLPLTKLVGSGVPANILLLLKALSALRR
jgi:hypothetical protein